MLKNEDIKVLSTLLYTNDEGIKVAVYNAVANIVATSIVNDDDIQSSDYSINAKKRSYAINEIAIIDRPKMERLINHYIKIKTGLNDDPRFVAVRAKSFLDIVGIGQMFSNDDIEDINNNLNMYLKATTVAAKLFLQNDD